MKTVIICKDGETFYPIIDFLLSQGVDFDIRNKVDEFHIHVGNNLVEVHEYIEEIGLLESEDLIIKPLK